MRTVLFVMTMCLLAVSQIGCAGNNVASVYGNPESEGVVGVGLGTEIAKNLEIGAVAQYAQGEVTTTTTKSLSKDDEGRKTTTHEHEDDWQYGVYSHLHFPVGDISPYVGAQATIGNGGDDIVKTIQPVAGVAVGPFFGEWQEKSLNGEKDKVIFGVRFRF